MEAPEFTGFVEDCWTRVPDVIFDVHLPDLEKIEMRCLLLIIRRTIGFRRKYVKIRLHELMHGLTDAHGRELHRGVGCRRRQTLIDALRGLRRKGFIVAEGAKGDALTYRLRMDGEPVQLAESGQGGSNEVETTPPSDPVTLSDTPQATLSDTPQVPLTGTRGSRSVVPHIDRQSLQTVGKDSPTDSDPTGSGVRALFTSTPGTGCTFDAFWEIWPDKKAKKAAEKAWGKLSPSAGLFAVMAKAVERSKRSTQWRRGFIPHLSTWLNGERWLDDVGNHAPPGPDAPTPRTSLPDADPYAGMSSEEQFFAEFGDRIQR